MSAPNPPAAGPAFDLATVVRRVRDGRGGGSVLDRLLLESGLGRGELAALLHREAGIRCVFDREGSTLEHALLDAASCRQWRCVPLRRGGELLLASEDPWDDVLLQRASRRAGAALLPAAVTQAGLDAWLRDTVDQAGPAAPAAARGEPAPVVMFVDDAINSGYGRGASDIHFECDRSGVSAKHRLDGVMTMFARLDGVQPAEEVISRIKVLAQLDITERRLPQDGRMRLNMGDATVDLRVSIMPSVHGEDAVLRLLDKARMRSAVQALTLELLGFDAEPAALLRELACAPNGMLLVTGPTGSGKTTTVYAALSEIHSGLEKIITIEDPVEYELPGVLQIPVNERKGLTFARGLRSILRHDPDRILIGEIRDSETAEIAVQSALTGHLVFTTVHANGMADVVGRFRHFGLDMFAFMSSLNGVVVQRLLRRICGHCTGRRPVTEPERQWLDRCTGVAVREVSKPTGCPHCHGSGYSGRFVVAEIHTIDDALRDHIQCGAPLTVLKAHAAARGVVPLAALAARHVLEGRTTPEEIKRVVGWA